MYVIAGVSGNTGSIVATALLDQGKKVRVIVRDAKKGAGWKARGAEVAVAAAEDEEALTKALEGAAGAYLISPPDVASSDFIAARRETVEILARAVERSKVAHVVFLSSVGAQLAAGTGMVRTVRASDKSKVSCALLKNTWRMRRARKILLSVKAATTASIQPRLTVEKSCNSLSIRLHCSAGVPSKRHCS